jgi:hypothetical protein
MPLTKRQKRQSTCRSEGFLAAAKKQHLLMQKQRGQRGKNDFTAHASITGTTHAPQPEQPPELTG